MNESIRITVIFSGDVQGVGFRYTTVGVADRFPVTGYVRNLPDGRVEMVAEGTAAQVRAFIEAVQEQMGRFIRGSKESISPATGEFGGFSIRR